MSITNRIALLLLTGSVSLSIMSGLAWNAAAQAESEATTAPRATLETARSSEVSGVPSGAPDSLTLDECIRLAIDNSPVLAQQRTAIARSNTGITSAYSAFYPSADLSTGIRNSEGFGGERQTSYSSSVGLGYSVYEGGYRRAGVEAARAGVNVAKEQYKLYENQLILQVKEAFFEILQKQEQISLVESVAKRRNEDLVIIRLKYQAGRESSPAVKEAEASLLRAQYDIERATQELDQAKVALNLILTRPGRSELALSYGEQTYSYPPVGTLVDEAKQARPELLAEKANRPALEAQVTQAKSSYLPKVSLSASYNLQGDEFVKQTGDWGAGLTLSLPIFDGYARKAKVTAARLSLKNQTDVLRELELQIEEDVEQAYSTWVLARDIVQVSEKTLEAAREIYLLTKLQYEQGATSYFFLQQKESDLTQAETSRLGALLNMRISAARLEKTLGRVNR